VTAAGQPAGPGAGPPPTVRVTGAWPAGGTGLGPQGASPWHCQAAESGPRPPPGQAPATEAKTQALRLPASAARRPGVAAPGGARARHCHESLQGHGGSARAALRLPRGGRDAARVDAAWHWQPQLSSLSSGWLQAPPARARAVLRT
jgi:hypothetical protein